MWETWVRFLGWEDPLEEGMATHSGSLAWRIPLDRGAWWLATVHGVTRVGHDLVTKPPLPERYGGSNFSTYFLTLILFFLNCSPLNGYKEVYNYGFDLHFHQFSSVA